MGVLKWIGGYRDERMENKFWGEGEVTAQLESAGWGIWEESWG